MESKKVVVVVGAGPGLGAALGHRFARASMHVVLACRKPERLDALAAEYSGIGHSVQARACDACNEVAVAALFDAVGNELGVPDVVIYNAGAFVQQSILDTSTEDFEHCWRTGCLGGFIVGREAARRLSRRVAEGGGGGTIIFTGATASLRGGARFHNLAVGKFGLRALSQSMARELGPQGIHVAHVVIDGRIRKPEVVDHGEPHGDELLEPDAVAEAYFQLHAQPRCAWTQELDLRPCVERF